MSEHDHNHENMPVQSIVLDVPCATFVQTEVEGYGTRIFFDLGRLADILSRDLNNRVNTVPDPSDIDSAYILGQADLIKMIVAESINLAMFAKMGSVTDISDLFSEL